MCRSLRWLALALVLASFSACLKSRGGLASRKHDTYDTLEGHSLAQRAGKGGPTAAGGGDSSYVTSPTGLKYRVVRASGKRKPRSNDTVLVHYRGWLDDGTEFDSTQGKPPAELSLRQVVPGWTEGLQKVGEGGVIELEVPPRLGYGGSGQGPIPPNATLHFEVELVAIR